MDIVEHRGVEHGDEVIANLPPAPKNPLPFLQRLRAVRSHHTGTDILRDAGGPVTLISLGPRWLIPPIVLATSPEGIRDICSARDGSIDKGSAVNTELRRLIGANSFVSPHVEWLPRRRVLQPLFTHKRVAQIGGHMAEAVEAICATWSTAAPVDLADQSAMLSLRTLGSTVFGTDFGAQADAIAEPLEITSQYVLSRSLSPLRAPSWLPTPGRRKARAAAAGLGRLANDILLSCKADPSKEAPLVQMLIKATDPETGQGLSDDAIIAELVSMLFAGYTTTATTLTYALWALGHHHDIQERVAAEAAAIGDRPLTPGDLSDLAYTTQVLQETLRICPPAATGTRIATQDVAIAGYRVDAGTTLAIGRRSVQRDPNLWESPHSFDPDRFSPQQSAARNRWQFLPFGAGPRSCLGQHFAMQQATLALADIIRRFEIDSAENDFPTTVAFTVTPDGPVLARVKPRRS
ncbi:MULTISPECIES: cytochrome P450 [unclassified Mycolicibacterium]|uniref:cytochrome P450 n=1 Tax=unclassified Mycolicibacterium TaxID=2636767 RepID=UPI001F2ABF87|nr:MULTISPECIES: cytochrome P450 [unclassified Mycolicibacterium]